MGAMTKADPLDSLRRAARRLHEAEIERNRVARLLRSERQPLVRLAAAADVSVGTMHKLTRPATLASAGYEGRTAEALVSSLVDSGVSTLVDVRENAVSRKPGLSKAKLAQSCAACGIDYVHEPSLGNPRSNRDGFREGLAASREAYERHLLVNGADALERVATLLKDRTVGLLCFEAAHQECHRSIVATHLLLRDPLVEVIHA